MTLSEEIRSRGLNAIDSLGLCATICSLAGVAIEEHGEQILRDNGAPAEEGLIDFRERQIQLILKNYGTLIPEWAFINMITVYEAWMSDVLRVILVDCPQKIRKQKVDSSIITGSSSYEECRNKMIDQELKDIFYAGPKEAAKRLQQVTSVDIENIQELPGIFELKALRDILLHNKGVVNKEYIWRAGDKARAKLGDEIRVNSSLLSASQDTIGKFIVEVSKQLQTKFTNAND